jgi:acetolactate synthase-1/3 small subunit
MGPKFVILAQNRADVLARVVMLFHRLAVDIESIRMPARDKKGELQIAITLKGEQPQSHRVEASLYKLVDVLSVETISRDKRSARTREMPLSVSRVKLS